MHEMTLAEWLVAQLKQLDNPAYRAGYLAGHIDGQRRAYESVLDVVQAAQPAVNTPQESANGS